MIRNLAGLTLLHPDKSILMVVEEGGLLVLQWRCSEHLFTRSVPGGWAHAGPEGWAWETPLGELFSFPLELKGQRDFIIGVAAGRCLGAERCPRSMGKGGFFLPFANPRRQSHCLGWDISPSFSSKALPGLPCLRLLPAAPVMRGTSAGPQVLG